MNLESEELNMEKIPEWIYAPTNFSPELEKTFEAVEKPWALNCLFGRKHLLPTQHIDGAEEPRRKYYGLY